MSKWEIVAEMQKAWQCPIRAIEIYANLYQRLEAECQAEDDFWCAQQEAEQEAMQAVGF
jgi:hypothetical protein